VSLRLQVLGPAGSPAVEALAGRARTAARALAPGAQVSIDVGEQVGVLIDGRALEEQAGFPDWVLEAGILRALRPRHFLFLCVANSARSQLAEGIARALAPQGVVASSAGSAPTRVRPQAIEVMREIGLDLSGHTSKHVSAIDPATVDVVVTLCGEEECPVFLGKALRVHWGLPDPAAGGGTNEEQLARFRETREELRRRFRVLFSGWSTTEKSHEQE